MNLGQLKDRIFRMTNHIYNDTFHMTDLVNNALNALANDAKLEGEESIAVTANTANYALPALYKSPRALVEGTIDSPTRIYDLVAIDEISYGYSIWNGEIVVKPTPSESKTLKFYFYKYATPLTDDIDEPEIDSQYHEILAAYASAMILSLPGMDNVNRYLVDRYFQIWDEGAARFKADMAKKTKQTTVRKVEPWR